MVLVRRGDRADAAVAMQVRAARAMLAWSQAELSARAGVAPRTLADLETGRRFPRDGTVDRLRAVFAEAGVELVDLNGRVGVLRATRDDDDRPPSASPSR